MKKGYFLASLATIAALLLSPQSLALEFSNSGGTFSMSGPINHGDARRFIEAYLDWEEPPTLFHIDSEGGDVETAMLIGRFIRDTQIPVWSGRACYSACVLVFVAGVERLAQGEIGLHRPYYSAKYFANLSASEAADAYGVAAKSITEYMTEMGVPSSIIDRMFRANSGSLDIIKQDDVAKLFSFRLPFYDEWVAAKCGRFSGDLADFVEAMRPVERLDIDTDRGRTQAYQHFESLRLSHHKAWDVITDPEKMPAFRDRWFQYQKCVRKAENQHVREHFLMLKAVAESMDAAL